VYIDPSIIIIILILIIIIIIIIIISACDRLRVELAVCTMMQPFCRVLGGR